MLFENVAKDSGLLETAEKALQCTLPMARLQITELPGLDQIHLALLDPACSTGPLPEEVMRAVIAEPAYWSVCWGSGLALAKWLLEKPDSVSGQIVADIGTGCGVAATAAKLAGAHKVWACDLDPNALDCCRANAAINESTLEFIPHLSRLPEQVDIVLLADVLYDRSNFGLLDQCLNRGDTVIVADSLIEHIDHSEFTAFARVEARTYPNLREFDEFRSFTFFRGRRDTGL